MKSGQRHWEGGSGKKWRWRWNCSLDNGGLYMTC